MILTKKDIQKLREQSFLPITPEQEIAILERFGKNSSDDYEWTEQDIYEQIRKMIRAQF